MERGFRTILPSVFPNYLRRIKGEASSEIKRVARKSRDSARSNYLHEPCARTNRGVDFLLFFPLSSSLFPCHGPLLSPRDSFSSSNLRHDKGPVPAKGDYFGLLFAKIFAAAEYACGSIR